MLPAAHRIRRSEDFRDVLRRGAKSRSELGLVSVLPVANGPARLGVVVSRKVGGAVVRNTLKRRIRHAFASFIPRMPPADVVVRCAESAAGLDTQQIEDILQRALGIGETAE